MTNSPWWDQGEISNGFFLLKISPPSLRTHTHTTPCLEKLKISFLNLHNGSFLLQVKAYKSTKVAEIAEILEEANNWAANPDASDMKCMEGCAGTHSVLTEEQVLECIHKIGSPCSECFFNCTPAKLQCTARCMSEHAWAPEADEALLMSKSLECLTEETSPCFNCLDKCTNVNTKVNTNVAGAVVVTSNTIFFSLAIAALIM